MSSPFPTLQRRGDELASGKAQRRILEAPGPLPRFEDKLNGQSPLRTTSIDVFQINVGKLCNQTCRHCHVDAGPDRKEIMTRETAEECVAAIERSGVRTVDITGGAPELAPVFRYLVEEARRLDCHVLDRCNLTVLNLRSQADLVDFLAAHEVEVVASLPYFQARQTDAQRGDGVFESSIRALKKLNAAGYGSGNGLRLQLVYNPTGAFLPPRQAAIEADFKRELSRRHDITIDGVYALTNLPISRFLEFLRTTGNYDAYLSKLVDAFNPAAADAVMCRTMVSVGWDGLLYDCDFNQMLDFPVEERAGRHVRDFDPESHVGRRIRTGRHCFGCTAGAGSSCGGETV
ncbi:MAG TPA: arsenosugar biosynthesis radical SAM (seleno)protein ArsS [bacterium]|nr:arsenosugar biosynthesis radical SAM (seleno)protein ArsS [bacterium]